MKGFLIKIFSLAAGCTVLVLSNSMDSSISSAFGFYEITSTSSLNRPVYRGPDGYFLSYHGSWVVNKDPASNIGVVYGYSRAPTPEYIPLTSTSPWMFWDGGWKNGSSIQVYCDDDPFSLTPSSSVSPPPSPSISPSPTPSPTRCELLAPPHHFLSALHSNFSSI